MSAHPLDRAVWRSLRTGWAAFAEGGDDALRIRPDHNVFAAARDRSDESQRSLAALVDPGRELWVVERTLWPAPPGTRVARTAAIVQMLLDGDPSGDMPVPAGLRLVDLCEADAPEMHALAEATRPGPFVAHTNRLGSFVGLRDADRLVAMAGERMALPGYREVSAVCTRPEYRGKGLAALLIGIVCARMAARGERAFLTSYADNAGAIALYERLGFRIRADMTVTILQRAI